MIADAGYTADLELVCRRAEVHELRLGPSRLAVVPAWQMRVATGSLAEEGASLGWLNRPKLRAGGQDPRANLWGGLERLWIGPEGGPGSVFFPPGADFDLGSWRIPALVDRLPFRTDQGAETWTAGSAEGRVENRLGECFDLRIERRIELLEPGLALGLNLPNGVRTLCFASDNTLINAGRSAWDATTGFLCLWTAGMFPHSDKAVAFVAGRPGERIQVIADYFGELDERRLRAGNWGVRFAVDGMHRSKIGVPASCTTGWQGAWDPQRGRLTLVYAKVSPNADYLEARWHSRTGPFGGEAIHQYNDGPAKPGGAPFGPFFELESSSPAARLAPGERCVHRSLTVVLEGPRAALEEVARSHTGCTLAQLESTFERA